MLKVVGLEGGPCGGKTTALDYIADNALCYDIPTIIIPEVASQMISDLQDQGKTYAEVKSSDSEHLKFQTDLLRRIADNIKQYRKIEDSKKNTLVLVDRVDNAAYLSQNEYRQVCENLLYYEPPMHTLVDTVLYFPTVAKINPRVYKDLMSSNPNRYESVEAAINTCDQNFKTMQNHPDVWLISEDTFERSLRYAANIALRGFSEASFSRVSVN